MTKAPVYRERGTTTAEKELKELRELCSQLKDHPLYEKLMDAVCRIETATVADTKVFRGNVPVGYGIKKAEKVIACDSAIAIIKQIKAMKAW